MVVDLVGDGASLLGLHGREVNSEEVDSLELRLMDGINKMLALVDQLVLDVLEFVLVRDAVSNELGKRLKR